MCHEELQQYFGPRAQNEDNGQEHCRDREPCMGGLGRLPCYGLQAFLCNWLDGFLCYLCVFRLLFLCLVVYSCTVARPFCFSLLLLLQQVRLLDKSAFVLLPPLLIPVATRSREVASIQGRGPEVFRERCCTRLVFFSSQAANKATRSHPHPPCPSSERAPRWLLAPPQVCPSPSLPHSRRPLGLARALGL